MFTVFSFYTFRLTNRPVSRFLEFRTNFVAFLVIILKLFQASKKCATKSEIAQKLYAIFKLHRKCVMMQAAVACTHTRPFSNVQTLLIGLRSIHRSGLVDFVEFAYFLGAWNLANMLPQMHPQARLNCMYGGRMLPFCYPLASPVHLADFVDFDEFAYFFWAPGIWPKCSPMCTPSESPKIKI